MFTYEVSPETEMKIAVQALRLNTHSKLTFADSKRFDSLIQDVFPDVTFQDVKHEDLEQALRDACKETNLVVIESQVICLYYVLCILTYTYVWITVGCLYTNKSFTKSPCDKLVQQIHCKQINL